MARIKLRIERPWIPYIIFVVALLITGGITWYAERTTTERDRLRFVNAQEQAQNIISNQLEIYVTLLRGTSGLIAAEPNLDKDAFQAYISRLALQERYKGIQGIGYISIFSDEQKDAFIDSASERTQSDVTVRPEGSRENYYVITFLGPEKTTNQGAIGLDIGTDSARQKAMNLARDSGGPATSQKLILGQTPTMPAQPGFFIFVPVYEDDIIPATVAERREKIRGVVYSPFRSANLFNTVLNPTMQPSINIAIYDGTTTDAKNLLHDTNDERKEKIANYKPRYSETKQLAMNGATWTIRYENTPEFESASQTNLPPFIFLGGIIVSFVFFMLSRAQYIARANAERSAHDLQLSQLALKKAIGMRDNFISIASHELKTPVTSLKVYGEVLLKRFKQKGEKQTTEYMTKMNKQIDKLTLLILDLLDVSRLQTGRLNFRFEKFDINQLVNEMVEHTQYVADNHTIVIKGRATRRVWGDRERIGQVINNFLTNAIKYSPKADKVIVSLKPEKTGVLVTVTDFGIGISREHQRKIFSRFYRVTDTDEQTYPGLGIGLYICNEIMKRHASTISIESTKGKGSQFSFLLTYSNKQLPK